MINVLLVVLIFSLMMVIMKLFARFGVDNLQAIVVNYITASALGFILTDSEVSVKSVIQSDWVIYAIGVGVMFILSFTLLARATQTVGLAIATVANKMSLVIPVFVAIWLYNEPATALKVVGIILALLGIYMTSTNQGKFSFNIKYLWVVLVIFIGQGIADTLFNHARAEHVSGADREIFFTVIFLIAGLIGLLFSILKLGKGGPRFHFKNVIWGVVLGVPNYFSLEFFFKALNSNSLDSSQVYPLINMGIVVLTSLSGLVLFREKLTLFNWIGVGLAVCAIGLLTL